MTAKPTRIVIVGGGIAGIQIATGLARAVGREGAASITLVHRSLSHVWKPMLHTFAAGTASADRQKIDFFDQAKPSGFHFQPGALASVDRSARRVRLVVEHTDDPETVDLAYDILVITARVAHALLYRQHQLGLLGPWRGPLTWLADGINRIIDPPVRLD